MNLLYLTKGTGSVNIILLLFEISQLIVLLAKLLTLRLTVTAERHQV